MSIEFSIEYSSIIEFKFCENLVSTLFWSLINSSFFFDIELFIFLISFSNSLIFLEYSLESRTFFWAVNLFFLSLISFTEILTWSSRSFFFCFKKEFKSLPASEFIKIELISIKAIFFSLAN
jgi:hypothetical protein